MIPYKSIDIIGGGIIGITLATEILRLIRQRESSTEVHLFERRGKLGIENTEKSFEGFRTYWFTPEEIRFYLHSIHAFKDLKAHFHPQGGDSSEYTHRLMSSQYRELGYHYFLSEKDFQEALQLREIFEECGVPLNYYSKDEAQKIDWIHSNFNLDAFVPDEDAWIDTHFDLDKWNASGLDLDSLLPKEPNHYPIAGYVHVPIAGFISVGDVVAAYQAVFEQMGGHLHLCSRIVGLDHQSTKIKTIRYRKTRESKSGELIEDDTVHQKSTDYVVNASGVWADDLNELVIGERLGITPHRRLAHIVQPPAGYHTDHGMVLLRNRVIRPEGDKIWLYYTVENEQPGIETAIPDHALYDTYFFKYIYPVFCYPGKSFIRNAESLGLYDSLNARGWMGHYADTADERPFIGVPRPDSIENYAVSSGYSGHGVQASIAAAQGLAHTILQLKDPPVVLIPSIYAADRDLTGLNPDHSRL
ncbi:NAD(P)/FAD-dependent oxidoreductase [bacterium]